MKISFDDPIEIQGGGLSPEVLVRLAIVKECVSFRTLFEWFGLHWKSDEDHQLSCPLHARYKDAAGRPVERNPSMHYYANGVEPKLWCFACNDGGDVVWLTKQLKKTDFAGAVDWLYRTAGLEGISVVEQKRISDKAKKVREANQAVAGMQVQRRYAVRAKTERIMDLIWDLKKRSKEIGDPLDRLLESVWTKLDEIEKITDYREYQQALAKWEAFVLDRIKATWQAIVVD